MYAEDFTNYFAVFSERGGQLFWLYSFYISLNGDKYCHIFVEQISLVLVKIK